MKSASSDRMPCSPETKRLVRAAKRGGETYDELLRKMLDQYDPDLARSGEHPKEA